MSSMHPPGKSWIRTFIGTTVVIVTVGAVWVLWRLTDPEMGRYLNTALGAATVIGSAAALLALRKSRISSKIGSEVDDGAFQDIQQSLSQIVSRQWSAEARILGLINPEPIRLTWKYAPELSAIDESRLFASPSVRLRKANSKAVGGGVTELAHRWRRLPKPRRLIIVGEKGAGKSSAAILLVHQLLTCPEKDDPVPVLLHLASWNAETTFFDTWVEKRIIQEYRFLGERTSRKETVAGRLLREGRIAVVLDGLDEVPVEFRNSAVLSIGDALSDGKYPVVLTCRKEEYEELLALNGKNMSNSIVITLLPVTAEQVVRYFESNQVNNSYWRIIQDELTSNPYGPLAQALKRPIMVYLLRLVCDESILEIAYLISSRNSKELEDRLLSRYISASYSDNVRIAGPLLRNRRYRSVGKIRTWLSFLANHLDGHQKLGFAWWELYSAIGKRDRIAIGSVYGGLIGLIEFLAFGWMIEPRVGVVVGIGLGGFSAVMIHDVLEDPGAPRYFGLSLRRLILGLVFGILFGALWGAAFGIGLAESHHDLGIILGLGVFVSLIVVSCLTLGISRSMLERIDSYRGAGRQKRGYRETIRAARAVELAMSVFFGVIFGGAIGIILGLEYGLFPGLVLGLALSIGFAAIIGLSIGELYFDLLYLISIREEDRIDPVDHVGNSWIVYCFSVFWLALRFRSKECVLPFFLTDFLEDAHRRGILRQSGDTYEFRHVNFQEYLTKGNKMDR